MRFRRQLLSQQIIEIGIQLTSRHDSRVLLLQRTRSSIARIGKKRLLLFFTFLVQAVELGPGKQDLPPYLKCCRVSVAHQFQRDRTDGFHVGRHIVATCPVATRHGSDQTSVLVCQGNGSSVIFQLGNNLERLVQVTGYALVKILHFIFRIGIAQRKHRIFMHYLFKLFGKVTPHPLGRRMRIGIFGMRLFKDL